MSRLADGGPIINISSTAGTRPMPVVPIYSMAKAASTTWPMRSRWGWDLGAKQGMPAVHENADMVKAIEAGTALGPFGGTSDIAVVVASLASDEGRWVTGQVIEASGGFKL